MNDMYRRIDTLCKQKGVNITRMCKEADVPRAPLTELKMGRTNMLSSKNLQKISSYFGVPMEILLDDDPDMTLLLDVFAQNNDSPMSGATVNGSSVVIGSQKNVQSTVHNERKEEVLSSLEAGILEKVKRMSLEDQVKVFNFITELEGSKG